MGAGSRLAGDDAMGLLIRPTEVAFVTEVSGLGKSMLWLSAIEGLREGTEFGKRVISRPVPKASGVELGAEMGCCILGHSWSIEGQWS